MELFSEIYGIYYQITAAILGQAPLKQDDIYQWIAHSGFAESTLQLLPKLLEEDGWPFLKQDGDLWHRRLEHPPCLPCTTLELRWLKSVLLDPRARLFFTQDTFQLLQRRFDAIPPLYQSADFCYFDRAHDGDPYTDTHYIACFQQMLQGLHTGTPQMLTYQSSKGSKHSFLFLPLKLEYSEKDDKFRMHGAQLKDNQLLRYHTINMGRILEIQPSRDVYHGQTDIDDYLARCRTRTPLMVQVSNERNGIERFLVEFSTYEKQSEYDENNDTCLVTLYYPSPDETEVLIKLLRFGPIIQVLSPAHMIENIRQRLQKQLLCQQKNLEYARTNTIPEPS